MKRIILLSLLLSACGKDVDFSNSYTESLKPIQLNSPLPASAQVTDKFQATSDGSKVVYLADQETLGQNELFVVGVDGKNLQKLNPPLCGGCQVIDFKISPNSQLVAFRMEQISGLIDLFTIRLDKTNLAKVNLGVPSGRQVLDTYEFMPNSSKLVFVTDEAAGLVGQYELYIANPDGAARQKLNVSTPVASVFGITRNGSRIVYLEKSPNPEIRSVLPTGSGNLLLNDPFNLVSNPAAGVSGFQISPNSLRVVFRTNQLNAGSAYDLLVVNVDGGAKLKLNGTLVSGGSVRSIPGEDFQITADSSRVIYLANQVASADFELFSSDLSAGSASVVKLNSTLATNGDVKSFKISMNSSRVVYLADQDTDGINELYSVNLLSNLPTKLNTITSGSVASFSISMSSQTVVYSMDKTNSGVLSLYSQPIVGGSEKLLSGVVAGGASGVFDSSALANAQQMVISSDSSKVVFRASLESAEMRLYQASIDGSKLVALSDPEIGSNVLLRNSFGGSDFLMLMDGSRVIYRQGNPLGNLYSVKTK